MVPRLFPIIALALGLAVPAFAQHQQAARQIAFGDVDSLVIPANSPVSLTTLDKNEIVARFRGKFTITGHFHYDFADGDMDETAYIVPDKPDQLPHWRTRYAAEIYLDNPKEFVAEAISANQLARLKRTHAPSFQGHIAIEADRFTAAVECDSASYTAHFVAVVHPATLAERDQDNTGC